jgi:uncharacterized protein
MATVSFRIDNHLKERLDHLADRRGLNLSHILRTALADKIDALEREAGLPAAAGFSVKDRLVLANQYRILAALYPGERERYLERVETLDTP